MNCYEFGPFRVDLAAYKLWRGQEALALTPKAFDTLVVLIRNRDRVVGKDELMTTLWPGSFVSEDSLTQSVSVLRRTLGDDPNQPQFIATAARHGYRFIAPVREVPSVVETPAPAIPPPRRAEAAEVAEVAPAAVKPPVRSSLMWIAVPVAFAIMIAALVISRTATVAPAPMSERGPLRFTQDAPAGTGLVSGGVLSPDGRYLAFVAQDNGSGKNQLWIRALDAAEPRALPGTDGAARPFWSPDSRLLGFFANGKLRQVGLDAQPPRAIASTESTTEGGGAWSTSGLILFTTLRSGLYSVPAAGGAVTPVTTLDQGTQEVAHRWPQFLPDGQHFLYFVDSVNADRAGTYLGTIGSTAKTRVIDIPAIFAPPGYLVYIRDRALTAQPFDLAGARATGTPTTIAGNAVQPTATNTAMFSAADGLMAFSVSSAAEHLEWFSRSGQRMGALDAPTALRNPALSPDDRQLLAASNIDPDHKGLWLIELERGALTRVASDGMRPYWSPDGQRFAFASDRAAGVADLYVRSTAGREGDEQPLVQTKENKFICDWSRDGKYLVFGSINARTKTDLWLLTLDGNRQPTPFLQTSYNEAGAQVSPDGHWVAYESDESGVWEVYVESFPTPGHKQIISVGGGTEPRWRRDGRELYYLAADRNLMAVDMKAGNTLDGHQPHVLFRAPVPNLNVYVNWYAPTADGQRFIVTTAAGKSKEQPITVLVNWGAHLTPYTRP